MTEKIYGERSKIFQKLFDIQKDIGVLNKEGKNTSQGYNYLSDEQLTPTIKKLLEKHKVRFNPTGMDIIGITPSPKGNQLIFNVRVGYTFVDLDSGEELQGSGIGSGADPTDKGIYKAITGAIKYVFIKQFLIPTQDDPEMIKSLRVSLRRKKQ